MAEEKNLIKPMQVSPDEIEEFMSEPAFLANKIYVSKTTLGVRISFAETHPEISIPRVRSAVYLAMPEALELSQLLQQQLKGISVDVRRKNPESGGDGNE